MKSLSDITAQVTKQNFSRKYIAIGRIVESWAEIVGAEMAARAQPVKIGYRARRTKKERPDAVLEIAVSSANATALHYQKDLILQRMEHVFGERWIADIKFVAVEKMPRALARRKRARRTLAGTDHDYLSEILGQIEDEAIKERLESLGHNILMDEVR